ncbi:hypothetical protein BWQ96_08093 [Gracilariopsis chorda]|uniref:Glycosyltransferase 61 catalytic domain-containing protein n=1 Tax=Gracilariopsis chorda TaxID=448386 RepID=A0A2V3IJF9_9FLOR|nr:hypothetical protein BWQ96_08093 [Gracilariopsis chorda]|eukprot:PXF42173.1 hypothetical protein BWQ96_08093 [Gracilariopsis chorda]
MLTEETSKQGFRLKTIVTSKNHSFDHQVRAFADVGFVVGIHGANLVNSIFMRPFSALFEVFPARSSSMCYYAGSNSGMFYQSHRTRIVASAEESGCRKGYKCWTDLKHTRVKISTKKDQDRIREMVTNGMRHVLELNARFPHGIPVFLDEERDAYLIDEGQDDPV